MLTIEQAQALRYGDILIQTIDDNGKPLPKPMRWRVVSKVKRWKRDSERFQVSVKHGIYTYGIVTNDNMKLLELA